MAVDGVGHEDAAEEKNFGDQKNPHAQRGGFLLLLQRLKLSVQLSGAMHAVLLFANKRPRTASYKTSVNRLRAPAQASWKWHPKGPAPSDAKSRTAPNPPLVFRGNSP